MSNKYIDPAYNRLLPVSLLAALIGLLLGLIPAIVSVLIAKTVFYPLFVAAPLFMYLFNSLLKGGRDIRALIVTAVFSLISAYLTVLACRAALYVSYVKMPVIQIPVLTALIIGRAGALPLSASANVYPLIFTALGVVIAALLLRGKPAEQCTDYSAQCTDEDEDTDEEQCTDNSVQCTNENEDETPENGE